MSDYDINHMKLDALLEFSFKYKLKIFEMFSRDKFYSMLTDKSKIELYKNGTQESNYKFISICFDKNIMDNVIVN